jgi:hypothetical protein
MKRYSLIFLSAMAAVLTVAVGACAKTGFEPIAVTKDPSVVASCQKIDDVKIENVKADEKVSDVEAQQHLTNMAREKGANYLLITSDDARQGTAYRCSMPPANAPAGSR